MIKTIVIGLLGMALGTSIFSVLTPTSSCEGDIYGKIIPIGGIVTTTEIESGDSIRAAGKFIILQRTDCMKCISSVMTDNDGVYGAYLSEGRYQIIIRDCGIDRNKDCIASNQPHFIDVRPKKISQFDISLVHSKQDNTIKIPQIALPVLKTPTPTPGL